MVHHSNNDNEIVLLDSVLLRDVLLNQHLAGELVSLGLERSCDLWVLALGELINLYPEFSNLLRKISQDFIEQWGLQEHSQYKTKIEFSSVQVTDNVDNTIHTMVTKHPSESTSVRVSISMKASRHGTVHWEALLPNSYLSQDIASGLYDDTPKRDFCLYFLSKARDGDIISKHWAQSSVSGWQDLLPKPTINIFVDWLHSTKFSQHDLPVFQERMGLISGQRKTLEEVGQEFDITRERVRQITQRFLRHLSHRIRRNRLAPFSVYLQKLFQKYGGIMTPEEISRSEYFAICFECFSPQPVIELILHCVGQFRALEYDYESGRGSSDISSVTWYLVEIEPESISVTRKLAFNLVDKNPCKYSFEELVAIVSAESNVPVETTKASLRTYKLIERDSDGLMIRAGWKAKPLTVSAMALLVLREGGVPLHFTAITEEINKHFPERNVKPNHVLNSLFSPIFRWVYRGTYGLAEWGLPEIKPKENYAAAKKAIKLFLQELNRPATTREVEEYLNKLADENPNFTLLSRALIILQNNPRLFVSLGQSNWGLVEWNMVPKPKVDAIALACNVLAEDETAWLTNQQLYMEMKSRGWTGPFIAVQRALDREAAKSKRRIQKAELHGFHIQLYGLSSRDWNEEAVLQNLLAD